MRELQWTLLCGEEYHSTYHQEKKNKTEQYSHCTTKAGVPVTWYNSIFDVAKGLSFYLAHEFFDALPIHQFQKTDHGWREVMVDIDEENGPHHLKFCLATSPTPATVLVPLEADGQVEVRPQGQVIADKMAQNINDCGGCSLIVDYGDIKSDRHTLRAFKNHDLTSPLAEPGHADLTSNVDFSQLRNVLKTENVETFGPVSQRNFLTSMGIDVRKEALLKRASPVQAKNIETAFEMLTDSSRMGDCFKVFSAVYSGTSRTTKPPPGF